MFTTSKKCFNKSVLKEHSQHTSSLRCPKRKCSKLCNRPVSDSSCKQFKKEEADEEEKEENLEEKEKTLRFLLFFLNITSKLEHFKITYQVESRRLQSHVGTFWPSGVHSL